MNATPNAERHARVADLFVRALDIPEAERDAWLHDTVGEAEVRQSIAALLEHHVPTGVLDESAVSRPPEASGA